MKIAVISGIHGNQEALARCPPDSPTIYLNHMSQSEIKETFASNEFGIAFAGHTHRLMLMGYDGKDLQFDPLQQGTIKLDRFIGISSTSVQSASPGMAICV